jgi:gliding motility-associated-like protein
MGGLKKILIFIILCGYFSSIYSQKEASIWYFGRESGLNFNFSPVLQLNYSAMSAARGCATISDTSGNLCFYTDGETVYNSTHQIMKNGTNIGGHSGGIQSAIIVPKPYNNSIYYIFTNNTFNYSIPNKFAYTVVDMSKQGGLGEVISKNNALQYRCPKFYSTEKLTAVLHSNKSAVWVITHKCWSDSFYCYQVNSNGVNQTPVISRAGMVYTPCWISEGAIKVSPDGKTLCAVMLGKGFEIFNFNNTSGKITGPIISVIDNNNYIGVEFSPDGGKLYLTENAYIGTINGRIWQIDLKAGNTNQVLNSKTLLAALPVTIGTGQVAIDGKIYIGGGGISIYNGLVIQKPNLKGAACNFTTDGFNFKNGFSAGLPQFIQSYFFFPNIIAKHLCLGDSTKFTLSDTSKIFSVFWNFGDSASGSNNNSTEMMPTHIYSDTGLYKVTVYVYHSGVPDTLTREIRIGLYPTASFTVNDTSQCIKANRFDFQDSSSIAVGGLSYEWNFGDSKKSFIKNPTHNYSLPGTYQARLSVLSDYGCIATQTTNLYVNNEPKAIFSVSDSVLCLKDNQFIFFDSSKISSGALTRVWKFGDNQTDTTRFSVHNYTFSDTFKATLVVSSNYGCKDSLFKQIIVLPSPVTSFAINDTNQCFKEQNFNFTNTTTITSGNLIYHWYINRDTFTLADIKNYKFADYGNYSARLTANTELGCADTMDIAIKVFDSPIAGFSVNDSSQCAKGNEFHTTNYSSLASGIISYEWDFGDKTFSSQKNPVHYYNTFGNRNINLIARTENLCSDTAIIPVRVFAMPLNDVKVNNNVQCEKWNRFDLNNFASSPDSLKVKSLWNFGDTILYTKQISKSFTTSGLKSAKLTSISDSGCYNDTTFILQVKPSPLAALYLSDTIACMKRNNFFIRNKSNISGGMISTSNLLIPDDNVNINMGIDEEIQHIFSKADTFIVKLIVTSDQNCKDTISRQIKTKPNPKLQVSADNIVQCLKQNNFTFKTIDISELSGKGLSYSWNFGDGISDTNQITIHKFIKPGTYLVNVIASSDENCLDTAELEITVHPSPVTRFDYFYPQCPDTNYSLTSKSDIKPSGSIVSYVWKFANDADQAGETITHRFSNTGNDKVSLITTSDAGCADTFSRELYINPYPGAIILDRATVTDNQAIQLDWKAGTSMIPLNWIIYRSVDNGSYSIYAKINPTELQYTDESVDAGKHFYSYKLLEIDSCLHTSEYSNQARPILLTIDTTKLNTDLKWTEYLLWDEQVEKYNVEVYKDADKTFISLAENNPSDLLFTDNVNKLDQSYYYYRITAVRNGDGLTSNSNKIGLPTKLNFYLPNAFTPNGDGLNDIFTGHGTFIMEYSICIYNRWGTEVFKSEDLEKGWDGKYNGQFCQSGVYYYRLVVKGTQGKKIIRAGTVILF